MCPETVADCMKKLEPSVSSGIEFADACLNAGFVDDGPLLLGPANS